MNTSDHDRLCEKLRAFTDDIQMAAERLGCEAAEDSLTPEGASLRAKMKSIASDLFKVMMAPTEAATLIETQAQQIATMEGHVRILTDREFVDHLDEPCVTSDAAFQEILHLREQVATIRRETLEEAARVATENWGLGPILVPKIIRSLSNAQDTDNANL